MEFSGSGSDGYSSSENGEKPSELLILTLKIIWQNYLDTNADDIDEREHWMYLFLFHFKFVGDSQKLKSDDFQSFFNAIPEEICSFLLRRVYEIICKTQFLVPDKLDKLGERENDNNMAISNGSSTNNDNQTLLIPEVPKKTVVDSTLFKNLRKSHNFTQLILNAPDDCGKVIALRHFLTDKLGHHLLEFLLNVDIKLIASQKGLCNLCINLFPDCAWDEMHTPLLIPKQMLAFIGDFNFLNLDTSTKNLSKLKRRARDLKPNCKDVRQPLNCTTELRSYNVLCTAYEMFRSAKKRSDDIAYMLVKLLIKCVDTECETPLSEHSMSLVLLRFALDKIPASNSFSDVETNNLIIKCALLQLIEHCLNNVFADIVNLQIIDFRYVLTTLSEGFPNTQTNGVDQTVSKMHTNGLIFLTFGVIHNLAVIETRLLQQQQQLQMPKSQLTQMNCILNELSRNELIAVSEICKSQLRSHLNNVPTDVKACEINLSIMNALVKIIEIVQKLERLTTSLQAQSPGSSGNNLLVGGCDTAMVTVARNGSIHATRPSRRRRVFNPRQTHCCYTHLEQESLRCYFQGFLLDLHAVVPRELQEYNMRYLLRAGICCCHYTLSRFGQLLSGIVSQMPNYQKYTYKFLHRKVLNSIFVRPIAEQQQQPQSPQQCKRRPASLTRCIHCDTKSRSLEYHIGLLEKYRELYIKLVADTLEESIQPPYYDKGGTTALILFLHHLKDIAPLLPNDIAAGILAEIALPIFRKHKCKFLQQKKRLATAPVDFWTSTLLKCLNIFAIYLSDIRLIKAFYNEENIQHLEDLLIEPDLVRGICDLIKIGIDNITFLGDSALEQTTLSRRLITLQLQSSDRAAQWFDAVLGRLSKFTGETQEQKLFWFNKPNGIEDASSTFKCEESGSLTQLTPLVVLKKLAQQWTLNNELLRDSQPFYNEFAKAYSITVDEDEGANENDDDNNADDDNDVGRMKKGTVPTQPKTACDGTEKTIIDILRLNYNALACFLLLPLRKRSTATMDFSGLSAQNKSPENDAHIYTFTPPFASPSCDRANGYNEDDCLYDSLDDFLLSSANSSSTSIVPQSICSYSVKTAIDDGGSGVDSDSDIANFQSYDLELASSHSVTSGKTFLAHMLCTNKDFSLDDSIVIFDIRNSTAASYLNGTTTSAGINSGNESCQNSANAATLTSTTAFLAEHQKSASSHEAAVAAPTITVAAATAIAAIQNSESVIGKVFRLFGAFLGLSSSQSFSDLSAQRQAAEQRKRERELQLQQNEIDDDLKCFYQAHSDCKKLLLKIFEATMAICIKGYRNEEAEKMEKHLRKLKAIILSNALSNWQQYSEEPTRDNAVLLALQAVLQIAELSSSLNETTTASGVGVGIGVGAMTATMASENEILVPLRSRALSTPAVGYSRQRSGCDGARTTPPTPRRSSRESVVEYLSTRASLMCAESDVELSEQEHEPENDQEQEQEYCLTADEGYEADGEIPDSESAAVELVADLWSPSNPSSRYRSHALHDGLCRLVVSIVIELAEKCVSNPLGWSDSLAQLAKRLYVIRDHLGGSLFLLRSFKPIFECTDVRLKELQQSILELITELNTPDILGTFFSILTAKAPPVDIVVKHMSSICANTLRKPQPCVELEFPILIDGRCYSSNVDSIIVERINHVRNYHLHSQVITPFTRAPCIIPIVHGKVWNNEGFTLALWLQIKSPMLSNKSSSLTSQTIDEEVRSASTEDNTKTHIASIGSNHIMLSIYLTNGLSLSFEVTKPHGTIQARSTEEASCLPVETKREEKVNTDCCGTNDAVTSSNLTPATPPSSFRTALKQTKSALLNTFSTIIHGPHESSNSGGGSGSSEPYFESSSSVSSKHIRLSQNKWTHMTFAVDAQPDHIDLHVHIDGLEQHHLSVPCRNVRSLVRSHVFQLLALGDSNAGLRSPNNSTSYNESHSSFDCSSVRWSVANLMLLNRKISNTDCLLNLTALGPDFTELTHCQVLGRQPNYGFLNLSKMSKANFGNFVECIGVLKESRILSYTAQQPEFAMGYNAVVSGGSSSGSNVPHGRVCGLIRYGELTPNHLKSVQTATILSGGLSNLLFLFARAVEASNNALTQSHALDILLHVAFSDSQLYAEFLSNDYFSLIGYVIKTERCAKDLNLLRSIVNNACSQPLIQRKSGEALCVNENTMAILVYPRLLVSILHRCSDWHRSGAEQSDVLDMLFQCVLALTREKHPQRTFNMEQLSRAGLFKTLLNLCKVYVIESPNPVYITRCAAQRFVEIVSVFAGAPAKPSLMDEIMKLLLLLHKPSECYITHDRSKFYFLLSALPPPAKDKSSISAAVNLSRVAAFRRNFGRERPGVAVAVSVAMGKSARSTGPYTGDGGSGGGGDAKRVARVNRLRRIHESSLSPYKRPIRELEHNLESTADCSKLNRNVLRLVNPQQATNWRTKFKRILRTVVSSAPADSRKIITHKRCRVSLPTRSIDGAGNSGAKRSTRPRCTRNSLSGVLALNAALAERVGSDDSVAEMRLTDVLRRTPTLLHRRHKPLTRADFSRSQGVIALQEHLFILLKDFLCLLPDNAVDEVLKHYIRIEFLLVLCNHSSCTVRAAILRLLAALTKRLPSGELLACSKNFYPQHLANQLIIHATDAQMFEACFEWVCGVYGGTAAVLAEPGIQLQLQQRFGANALLAIGMQLTAQHVEYAEKAFRVLGKLFNDSPEDRQFLIDNSLLQCCIKALHNLYSKANIVLVNAKTEAAIQTLLADIGGYSLRTVGSMNVIWDILNMLAFYQENQPTHTIKGFRSMQGQLQYKWISMFFGDTSSPAQRFKVVPLTDSALSLSEMKTRLGLLIDRCCQFFTIFDASYAPTDNEIKLFELLVFYCISTNQRCNNFIAWGLQPSRPRALRAFIVDALWKSCQDDFQPSIICDGKMIKSLLWLCLLEDLEQPIENLECLCKHLAIDEKDSVSNLENEIDRMELNRCTMSAKQKLLLEKTVYKLEPLAISCIEASMVTTRRVAELQNAERKLLMGYMKDYDETSTCAKWMEIIRRMTHEGAPWYCKERCENSWELDNTEGPSRVHTRLRRCHLDINKRFIMPEYDEHDSEHNQLSDNPDSRKLSSSLRSLDDYIRPLDYLISSYDQQLNISLNAQILYNFPAKYLPIDGEIDGEIIITDHKLYFLATYRCKYFYVTCDISTITEIWIKRYQHKEKAFEIFLDTNQSLFFSLQNHEDWKIMRDIFCDKIVSQPDQVKILSITQQWREGLLTNWEYLMTLNQISGRTYNDLMQYPVFPWILSNYISDRLDLKDARNFRKLEKPIAVQHEANEEHYINNYAYISNTKTNMGSLVLQPYHYSSHYSNSGTVLHFLVRVPPFTSYFLRYQDNNFDLPDRTFHALSTTWSLASHDSPTDVKELIPEFFCLPEMFENFERFNFGCRQNGERVESVLLPPWSQRDSRLFVLIHRQALECEIVRKSLHQWIDLIFGFKQSGENAIDAINVFHPATYSTFVEAEITDPIVRRAVDTMVKTYGQMPRQLFKGPHPASNALKYCLVDKQVVPSVQGLRWGVYLGSPQLPPPSLGNIHKLPGAAQLVSFNNTNVVYGLSAKACVMQGTETDTFNVVSWGHDDRIVRIQPLNKLHAKPKNLLHNSAFDEITACGADPSTNQLWFGHRSGRITVYKCLGSEAHQRPAKSRQSYVRGLRLSYNSAFRKMTSTTTTATSTSSSSEAASCNGLTSSDLDVGVKTAGSSATNLALGHPASESTQQQRDSNDSADLSWIGPAVLIRHTDEITAICLSVEFKIAVSAGRDGIAVIWDLNDWSYVRTIQRPAEIHHSPITLIAISPTLGDIVTVHTLPRSETDNGGQIEGNYNAKDLNSPPQSNSSNNNTADECFEVTEENLDDFVNVCINPNGKSILRLHTVNARYVQHILHEERILAICYSYIKEGVGVNVIATAMEGGIVRLWSSWNLSFVTKIITGISNIKSITYSTHQHLVVLTKESRIQVWETEGLYGSAPKFPQIIYN